MPSAAQSRYGRPGPLSPARNLRAKLIALATSRLAIAAYATFITLILTETISLFPKPKTQLIDRFNLTPLAATAQSTNNNEQVLILTPLKDAAPWLEEYFHNLQQLTYPPHLISLAFLVSDSKDGTVAKLESVASQIARGPKHKRFKRITILEKDFAFDLKSEARHGFEGQPVRRAFIARARNWLVTAALGAEHSWVLWLDVDVVRYDPNILEDLMGVDKDVVVPNTIWHQPDSWEFWGFDRNNFAETEESLALLAKLGPDTLLVEGYGELHTHRQHLVDMPTHLGLAHVPLDGVGCTFTLVKAHVHRDGVMFPTYVFDNQVETEGLAKMAKRAGFEVVGVPGVIVFHAKNH